MRCFGYRGCGKCYYDEIKEYKRICLYYFGLGYIFATAKVKCILIESVRDLINELSSAGGSKKK